MAIKNDRIWKMLCKEWREGGGGGERVEGEVIYWKKNAIFKNQLNSLTDYYRNYTLFFFLKRLEDTTTIIILQFLMKEYYLQ